MRSKGKIRLVYMVAVVAALSLAACGNSKKKDKEMASQPQDTMTVIETESVTVVVDSIAPDSTAMKQMPASPEKGK